MQRRTIIGLMLGLGLFGSVAFVACRGPKPRPSHGIGTPSAPPPPAPLNTAAAGASANPSATPGPVDTVAAAVASARSCQTPSSRITNLPDGGQVWINAWHRKDAGNIDRLEGVVGTLVSNASSFQCCFDVWASKDPGAKGTLLLAMELTPDGKVKEASVDDDRSDVEDAVTRACVVDVAKGLTYPPSPSGVATRVEYPFVVQSP